MTNGGHGIIRKARVLEEQRGGGSGEPARKNTVVRQRPDCRQLFFVYTGFGQQLMMPPMRFFQQAELMDRNLVMFRDRQRACFLRGLSEEVPDVSAFVRLQGQIVQRLEHVRDVYCIGTSAGAYAALLYGHELGVRIAWAFGPPVQLSQKDDQFRAALEGLELPDEYWDLSRLLAKHNGVTEYRVFYNESFERDRLAAESLRACPGVKLFPQDGEGHAVVPQLCESGKLANLMPPFTGASDVESR